MNTSQEALIVTHFKQEKFCGYVNQDLENLSARGKVAAWCIHAIKVKTP